MSLIAEIGSFLADLKNEFPDIFGRPPAPRGALKAPPPDNEALGVFHARVSHWAPLMGVAPSKIRVGDQKSLWGSCSRRGTLSFNRRLLEAPPEVLDYVVIHELAHLSEMNHSRRFWAIVARFCPEHRRHRRWLRDFARGISPARPERDLLQALPAAS